MPKSRLQDNKIRSKRNTIKRVKQKFEPYKTKQNLSIFGIKNQVFAPLYIEVKNLSYILVQTK